MLLGKALFGVKQVPAVLIASAPVDLPDELDAVGPFVIQGEGALLPGGPYCGEPHGESARVVLEWHLGAQHEVGHRLPEPSHVSVRPPVGGDQEMDAPGPVPSHVQHHVLEVLQHCPVALVADDLVQQDRDKEHLCFCGVMHSPWVAHGFQGRQHAHGELWRGGIVPALGEPGQVFIEVEWDGVGGGGGAGP